MGLNEAGHINSVPVTGSQTFHVSQEQGADRAREQEVKAMAFPPFRQGDSDVPDGMTLEACDDIMRGIVDDDDGSDNEARAVQFCGADAKYTRVMEVARMLDEAEERGRARQEHKMLKEVLHAQEESSRLRQEAITRKYLHESALNEIAAMARKRKDETP